MKMLIKTIFCVVTAFAFLPFTAQAGNHEGGAEMSKLDTVRLGDTVVVVLTEALVLSLKEV